MPLWIGWDGGIGQRANRSRSYGMIQPHGGRAEKVNSVRRGQLDGKENGRCMRRRLGPMTDPWTLTGPAKRGGDRGSGEGMEKRKHGGKGGMLVQTLSWDQ